MFRVDLYQFHYHFRYSSFKQQEEIKTSQKNAKLSLKRVVVEEPFCRVCTSFSGIVDFQSLSAESCTRIDGQSIRVDDGLYIENFVLVHIGDELRDLNVLIPEFLVSIKPEWRVTCTLKKVGSYQVSERSVERVRNVSHGMSESCAQIESELLLVPYLTGGNTSSLEDFLQLSVLEKYFSHYERRSDFTLLDHCNSLNQALTMKNSEYQTSLPDLAALLRRYLTSEERDFEALLASSNELKLALEQANMLTSLVQESPIVTLQNNYPYYIEYLDFISSVDIETKSCYVEELPNLTGKRWYRSELGPVGYQMQRKMYLIDYPTDPIEYVPSRVYGKRIPIHSCQISKIDYHSISKHIVSLRKPIEFVEKQMAHYKALLILEQQYSLPFSSEAESHRLLRTAFTHSAYANQNQLREHSYERLEYLGDSVLHLTCAIFVYKTLSGTNGKVYNGDWFELFMHLIGNKQLQKRATEMGLHQYILSVGTMSPGIVSDVFEAIVGALFTAFGFEVSAKFIETHYLRRAIEDYNIERYIDTPATHLEDENLNKSLMISHEKVMKDIEKTLGYRFNNRSLLLEALVHCTYNESLLTVGPKHEDKEYFNKLCRIRKMMRGSADHPLIIGDFNRLNSEKLRFLGLAIFKFYTSAYLYQNFPQCEPRQLTLAAHAALDHFDVVMQHGIKELGLFENILYNKDVTIRSIAVFDCYAAIIAAVFVDHYNLLSQEHPMYWKVDDCEPAEPEVVVRNLILQPLQDATQLHPDNMTTPLKNHVQHFCHLLFGQTTPVYKTTENDVENGTWRYKVSVICKNIIVGEHYGMNKKATERDAAYQAIHKLEKLYKEKQEVN